MNRTQDQVPPMPEITGRLRDAFQTAADTVQPGAVSPFSVLDGDQATRRVRERPGGAGLQHRHRQRQQRQRQRQQRQRQDRQRALAPAAAAVAVVMAVAGSVLAARVLSGSHPQHTPPTRPSAPRHTAPAPAIAGTPPFFIEESSGVLGVHASATGALLAEVNPPQRGEYFAGVAGVGTGATFVVAVETTKSCRTWLYDLRLSATGQPEGYTPLSVPAIPEAVYALAASADGTAVGYAGSYCGGAGSGDVGMINIASRQIRRWSAPKQEDIVSVSLSADGSLLTYLISQTKLFPGQIGELPTHSPTGTLAAHSTILVRQASLHPPSLLGYQAIAAEGTALVYSADRAPPARTGALLSVTYLHVSKLSFTIAFREARNLDIALDPLGPYLLAQFTVGSSSRLDRVNLRTRELTPLTATDLSSADTLAW